MHQCSVADTTNYPAGNSAMFGDVTQLCPVFYFWMHIGHTCLLCSSLTRGIAMSEQMRTGGFVLSGRVGEGSNNRLDAQGHCGLKTWEIQCRQFRWQTRRWQMPTRAKETSSAHPSCWKSFCRTVGGAWISACSTLSPWPSPGTIPESARTELVCAGQKSCSTFTDLHCGVKQW